MIQRRAKRGHSKRLPAALLWAGVLLSTLILVAVEFHVVQVRPNLRLGTALTQGAARWQPSKLRRPIDYLREHAEREAPEYPEACRQRYHGLPFLQTMLDAWRQPVCAPQGHAPLNSSLRCWFQFDQYAEAYCTGANLALDLAKFVEEEESIPRQASNRNSEGYFVTYKRPGLAGELLGDCRLDAKQDGKDMWKAESFGNGGQQWLYNSFRAVPDSPAEEQPVCVGWVGHPLYFLNDKYDSLNVWHALEDVTHAFEAWALKGWGREAQIVVLDQVSPESVLGPTYLPVWLRAFSSPARPPVLLRTLAEDAIAAARAANRGRLPPRAALCFRDAFFSVHGGISLLSRSISSWTPCHNSTTVNALVRFMLDGLQLSDVLPASHEAAAAARRAQGGPTPLPPPAAGGLGLRVVWALRSTRAELQAEVLAALQQRIPQETGAQVSAVEFGGLSIEEQMRRARQADVLVGYHGAALTLALFQPPQSALVEIESSFRCACYTNCALWRGHPYSLIRDAEWASEDGGAARLADEVVSQVKKALEEVQRRLLDG